MVAQATLESQIRNKVGGPDTTELTALALTQFLTIEALDWINRRRPGEAISSFTTVNAQQDYDEKPANAYRVTEVYWMGGGYDLFSPSVKFLPSSMDLDERVAGFSVIDNPALVEGVLKSIEQYKDNFKGSGWETEHGKIRLEPRPGEDGETVYFVYTYPLWSAVTAVPNNFVEGLRCKAAALCAEYLAARRSQVVSGRDYSGDGGSMMEKMAERLNMQADECVPPRTASLFARG